MPRGRQVVVETRRSGPHPGLVAVFPCGSSSGQPSTRAELRLVLSTVQKRFAPTAGRCQKPLFFDVRRTVYLGSLEICTRRGAMSPSCLTPYPARFECLFMPATDGSGEMQQAQRPPEPSPACAGRRCCKHKRVILSEDGYYFGNQAIRPQQTSRLCTRPVGQHGPDLFAQPRNLRPER